MRHPGSRLTKLLASLLFLVSPAGMVEAGSLEMVCGNQDIEAYVGLLNAMHGWPAEVQQTPDYSTVMQWPTLDGWESVSVIKHKGGCAVHSTLDGFYSKPIWWDVAYRELSLAPPSESEDEVEGVQLAKARIQIAWSRLSGERDIRNCSTHANYLQMAEYCFISAIPDPPMRLLLGDVTERFRRQLRRQFPLHNVCREPSGALVIRSLSAEQERKRKDQLCGMSGK